MNKIQLYDLSVGDWVQWNGKTYRVCLIDGVSLTVELAEELGGTIEVAIDEVTGIPLTAEIFEKNGLVRDTPFPDIRQLNLVNGEREDVVTFCYGGGRAPWGKVDSWPLGVDRLECCNENSTLVPYMEFVHQLQCLYRLAGIEKEIEP